MTSRRTRLATVLAAAALGATGLGVLAGPATAATPAPSAKAAACDKTPWGSRVQGYNDSYKAGATSGDYLWHSKTGFHLRVTHGNTHDARLYSGEIRASAPMRISDVRLEKGDYARLSKSGHTLVFLFSNHGFIDGVDFHTDCASRLTVERLRVGSSNLPKSHVFLGKNGVHPKHMPFTVHRLQVPTPTPTS